MDCFVVIFLSLIFGFFAFASFSSNFFFSGVSVTMADVIFLLLRVVFCLGPALENGLITSGDKICCLEVLGVATVAAEVKCGDDLILQFLTILFSSPSLTEFVEDRGVDLKLFSIFSLSKFNSSLFDCD